MFTSFLKLIKKFIVRIPVYIILYYLVHMYAKYFTVGKEIPTISLYLFALFLSQRFLFFLIIDLFNNISIKLQYIIKSNSYYLHLMRLINDIKPFNKVKVANKAQRERFILVIRLKSISLTDKDKYSLELREKNLKIIEEILAINKEMNRENVYNFDLNKRFIKKYNEHLDIIEKYSKHTKNI